MSVTEMISEIKTLSVKKRKELYDILLADKKIREDLLDILTIKSRRREKNIPISAVFKKLGIKA